MAQTKIKKDAGHDAKSLLINLSTILLFCLPFALYIDPPHTIPYCISVAASLVLALLVPPVGSWMRPHPYSDKVWNKPWGGRE